MRAAGARPEAAPGGGPTLQERLRARAGEYRGAAVPALMRVLMREAAAALDAKDAKDAEIERVRLDAAVQKGAAEILGQCFAETCDEIGCARDNEAALMAVAGLKARVAGAEVAMDAMRQLFRIPGSPADKAQAVIRAIAAYDALCAKREKPHA